jgi:hypothetical protein
MGLNYCSRDEESIYIDAYADVYSTAALLLQAVRWWLVAGEGLLLVCLVS